MSRSADTLRRRGTRGLSLFEALAATAFLGATLGCAQCHNHFMAPEIQQKDYWGLVAFFNRSKNVDTIAGTNPIFTSV